MLERCWWESYLCDSGAEEKATCFVAPPGVVDGPRPVVLFLTGNGHVDDREDFFVGGVDLLLQNQTIREQCFVLAPKPMTASGLLRRNRQWRWTWSEDAVWSLFTEVLRRLGPEKVDTGRLCVTGISLGASAVWHLALSYGQYLAAVVPISGQCEWPGDSWRWGGVCEAAMGRLQSVALRAYHIDVDYRAGHPGRDIEWLSGPEETREELTLPGVEQGTTCAVTARRWLWGARKSRLEFWSVAGPLRDWSAWDSWGGDKHCLWYRVYPAARDGWDFAAFLLAHRSSDSSRWSFDLPPFVADVLQRTWAPYHGSSWEGKANSSCQGWWKPGMENARWP